MATAPQYPEYINGEDTMPGPREVPGVQDILVAYDQANDGVTVNPNIVPKGATVRFRDPNGGKLRIAFLTPIGEETRSISDSDVLTLTIGGAYHFKCYFTLPGTDREISPKNGGVIDVSPHRP